HGRLQRRQRVAHLPGRLGDALEGHLEVAVNVVVQRLQRRDVEDAHPTAGLLLAPQPVEAGQEGGQRLAGAGRRQDEGVLSGGDGRPALALGGRRLAQRTAEPLTHRGQEQVENGSGVHASIVHACAGGGARLPLYHRWRGGDQGET